MVNYEQTSGAWTNFRIVLAEYNRLVNTCDKQSTHVPSQCPLKYDSLEYLANLDISCE